jgi:hypothetical protein
VPQEWTPTATNDAGEAILGDTPGAVIDGLSLRDVFIAYKSGSCYILSYVGGTYVYQLAKLYLSDGVAARNCIQEHQGEHYVLTGSDVIAHDGQNSRSVLYGKVHEQVLTSINADRLETCFLTLRRLTKQLYVAIPTGGANLPNTLVTVDLVTGDCGLQAIAPTAHIARGIVRMDGVVAASWDADAQAWDADVSYWNEQNFSPANDTLLACMPNDVALMTLDFGDLGDTQQISAWVERVGLSIIPDVAPVADVSRILVKRLALRLDGHVGDVVQVRVGSQEVFADPVAWGDTIDYHIGDQAVLPVMVEGRLISLRIDATTSYQWRLHSYRMEYSELGVF